MNIIPLLMKEVESEAVITRKMLQLVPDDKLSWQPHTKSMTMTQLTTHITELPSWIALGLHTTELDFATAPYEQTPLAHAADLLPMLEKAQQEAIDALGKATEDDLLPTWTLRNGEQIYAVMTKYEIIRHAISQTIHHRAQLGVYLRLLNIPIPGSYGPSADDMSF